jgi:hypothetical protein
VVVVTLRSRKSGYAPVEKHFQEGASTQRSLHYAALRSR